MSSTFCHAGRTSSLGTQYFIKHLEDGIKHHYISATYQ